MKLALFYHSSKTQNRQLINRLIIDYQAITTRLHSIDRELFIKKLQPN